MKEMNNHKFRSKNPNIARKRIKRKRLNIRGLIRCRNMKIMSSNSNFMGISSNIIIMIHSNKMTIIILTGNSRTLEDPRDMAKINNNIMRTTGTTRTSQRRITQPYNTSRASLCSQ
jgi:hypothetical protein